MQRRRVHGRPRSALRFAAGRRRHQPGPDAEEAEDFAGRHRTADQITLDLGATLDSDTGHLSLGLDALCDRDHAERFGQTERFVESYESGGRLLDPAEYIAICRAIGVDPFELLQKAEKEVGN